MKTTSVYRSILALDIQRSTGPLRTDPIRAELRALIYRFLDEAMDVAGIDRRHCDPLEDRGDGLLALIHPVDSIPKVLLLQRVVSELTRKVRDYNANLTVGDLIRRELRLRVVVHAGEVHCDGKGYFGEDLDVAFRLLDAPRFKRESGKTIMPLGLIVSETIYWSVVQHEYDGIRRRHFRPAVQVRVGGRRRQGFICDLGGELRLDLSRIRSAERWPVTWPRPSPRGSAAPSPGPRRGSRR